MMDFTEFDVAKPVATRGKQKVRLLCTDGPAPFPIAGYIEDNGAPSCWTEHGFKKLQGQGQHRDDLINVPDNKVMWVNVHTGYGAGYHTQAAAEQDAHNIIPRARLRVEYVEGQFDEEPETEGANPAMCRSSTCI